MPSSSESAAALLRLVRMDSEVREAVLVAPGQIAGSPERTGIAPKMAIGFNPTFALALLGAQGVFFLLLAPLPVAFEGSSLPVWLNDLANLSLLTIQLLAILHVWNAVNGLAVRRKTRIPGKLLDVLVPEFDCTRLRLRGRMLR